MSETKQSTFDDVSAIDYIQNLNQRQINTIYLLEQGYHQAEIARRLKCDKALINRTVKKLEEFNLIAPERIYLQLNNKKIFKKQDIGKIKSIATADPWRGRATTYIITQKLKNFINKLPSSTNLRPKGDYSLARIHHIKYKYPILTQDGDIDINAWRKSRSKTIHVGSWNPKGRICHQFHVKTPNGVIGVEYQGGKKSKSLIGYPLERKHVMAKDPNDLVGIAAAYVQEGISIFIQEQYQSSNCTLHLGDPMRITKKPHYAFESTIVKGLVNSGKELSTPGFIIDDSLKAKNLEGGDTLGELETDDLKLATEVDIALRNALNFENIVATTVATTVNSSMDVVNTSIESLVAKVNLLETNLETSVASKIIDNFSVLNTNLNTKIDSTFQNYSKTIEPLIYGGTSAEFKVNQLMGVMGKNLEIQTLMQQDNLSLKKEVERLSEKLEQQSAIITQQNTSLKQHEEVISKQNSLIELLAANITLQKQGSDASSLHPPNLPEVLFEIEGEVSKQPSKRKPKRSPPKKKRTKPPEG